MARTYPRRAASRRRVLRCYTRRGFQVAIQDAARGCTEASREAVDACNAIIEQVRGLPTFDSMRGRLGYLKAELRELDRYVARAVRASEIVIEALPAGRPNDGEAQTVSQVDLRPGPDPG